MSIQAVVFDFYGTLTLPVTGRDQAAAVEPLANIFGVPLGQLMEVMDATFSARCQGQWGSFEETISRLAAEVGVELSDDLLRHACKVKLESQWRNLIRVRNEAENVLRSLDARDLRIGLISDCTHELLMLWDELPISQFVSDPVFSVEIGFKKPDRYLYELVASRLGVPMAACLYVGDGGSRELSGALGAGMQAVLLEDPTARDVYVYDQEQWHGARIANLEDVLELATGPANA